MTSLGGTMSLSPTSTSVTWIYLWTLLVTLASGATNFTQSICTRHYNYESALSEQDSTLYLSCPQGGLIYILQAFYGRSMSELCAYTAGDTCISNALYAEPVVACLGASSCSIPALPIHLQRCQEHSTYLHVKYQCLTGDDGSKFNVCGYDFQRDLQSGRRDSDSGSHVPLVPTGHIMSPSFPRKYPKLSYCDCVVTAAIAATTRIAFEVLDFRLESSDACQYDFLEIVRADQDLGTGVGKRMCGGVERRKTHTVSSHQARVVMQTDDNVEFRGFWIRVWAISGGTTKVPISVQCQHHAVDSNNPAKRQTVAPPRRTPLPTPRPRPPYPTSRAATPTPPQPGQADWSPDLTIPPSEGTTTMDKRRIWPWTLPPATGNARPAESKGQDGFVSRNTGIIIGVCVVGLITMVVINIVGIIICRRQMLANRAKRTPTSSGQGTNSLDSLTSLETEYVSLNSNGASYHSGLSDARDLYSTIVSAVGANGQKVANGHVRVATTNGIIPNYDDGVVIERTPGVGSTSLKASDYDYGILPATYTRKSHVTAVTNKHAPPVGKHMNHYVTSPQMTRPVAAAVIDEDPYGTLRYTDPHTDIDPTYATIDRRKSLRRSHVRDYMDYEEIESYPGQAQTVDTSPGLRPDLDPLRASRRSREPEYVYVRPQTRPEEIPIRPQSQVNEDIPSSETDSADPEGPECTYAQSEGSSTARSEYL